MMHHVENGLFQMISDHKFYITCILGMRSGNRGQKTPKDGTSNLNEETSIKYCS